MKKEVSGFSLVELMFTLVAISCILAVFAPVISKKIKSGGMSLTVDTLKGLKTDECSEYFGSYCTLCDKNTRCIICNITCSSGQTIDEDNCKCVN